MNPRPILAAVLCTVAAHAGAVNIVVNPNFESGAAGWNAKNFAFISDPTWARLNPGAAQTSCIGLLCVSDFGQGAYIRQTLVTTPGEHYDLSFWVRSYSGVGQYTVFWDGAKIDDRIVTNGPMLNEFYASLAASSSATILEIHGRNDASLISFDEVSVVQTVVPPASSGTVGMVPEPLTWAMLAAGLGVIGLTMRRRA